MLLGDFGDFFFPSLNLPLQIPLISLVFTHTIFLYPDWLVRIFIEEANAIIWSVLKLVAAEFADTENLPFQTTPNQNNKNNTRFTPVLVSWFDIGA